MEKIDLAAEENIFESVIMLKNISANLKSYLKNLPRSFFSPPFSDILFVNEGMDWVTSWEIREIAGILKKLDIPTRHSGPIPLSLPRQSLFFANKYVVLNNPGRYLKAGSRIAFPYYHGRPETGEPLFVTCYKNLCRYHHKITRIQVTNTKMRELILESGIDPWKVLLIPIGINPDYFKRQTPSTRTQMREKYKIPVQATVIGSFQKDGIGWGEGENPKLTKGPDVFLEVLRILKNRIKDLFVLLSGPARGYVKQGLHRLHIPYNHIYLEDYRHIGELYQCLDLYIIFSREEGGPKAVLESMASGIPLITTKVGQAIDLVEHGENGWMVEVGDTEGLAYWAEKALADTDQLESIGRAGLRTARLNSYEQQTDLWSAFFEGFIATSQA